MDRQTERQQRSQEYDQLQAMLGALRGTCQASKAKAELAKAVEAVELAFYYEYKYKHVSL